MDNNILKCTVNKKYSLKTYSLLVYGSLGLVALSIYPFKYYKTYLMTNLRYFSVAGLLVAALGMYYCHKLEDPDRKKYKWLRFDYETLILAIFCVAMAILTIFGPFIHNWANK